MTVTANTPKMRATTPKMLATDFSGPLSLFSITGNVLTLDYTAYYPLYKAESLIIQSQIAKDDSYLSGNTHNIENDKY
jgi:hypothetical protein